MARYGVLYFALSYRAPSTPPGTFTALLTVPMTVLVVGGSDPQSHLRANNDRRTSALSQTDPSTVRMSTVNDSMRLWSTVIGRRDNTAAEN